MGERRGKGTGSVVERSPGTWRVRYQAPSVNGQRKWGSETVRGTRRQAEKLLREKLRLVENKSYVPKTKESVGEFLQSFIDGYGGSNLSPRTLDGYRSYINRYMGKVANLPLPSLTPQIIQEIYSGMGSSGLSNTTILRLHRVLHKAFKIAVEQDKLLRNPCDKVLPPKKQQTELKVWDTSTLEQFLNVAKTSRFYDVYRIAVHTGLRRSELCGLKWEQVDLVNGSLSVTQILQRVTGRGLVEGQPKTKRSRRSVDLNNTAFESLRTIQGWQLEQKLFLSDVWEDSGYVVTDEVGRPLDANVLTHDFQKIVTCSGLPHMTFHGLRHMTATLLMKAGKNPKVVQELLGHSTIGVTMDTYSHVMPGLQKDAVSALDDMLNPGH